MDGRIFVQFTQHQLIIGTVVTKKANISFASLDEFDQVRGRIDSEEIKQRLGLVGSEPISFQVMTGPDELACFLWRIF